ncbi:MAG: alpha/beta fold hydrolase [Caldilineaceae bacterium]
MLRFNHFLTLLVLAALILSACQPIQAPVAQTAPMQTKGYTPRYESAPCKYDIPEGDKVECGYLTVPEDRSHPERRLIRLYVVNFKSKSANPAPDPVILLHGGPGGPGAFMSYLWTATSTADLRAERDNIMLEHRGTNYSEPALYCPETKANVADLVGMSFAEEVEWSGAALRACAERLQKAGWNLSSYNAQEAAADVMDLRVALGYPTINVLGVSYGTLPAMQLLRYKPEGIRSIVVDSVEVPEVNWITEMITTTHHLLNNVFQACANDAACKAAYPDLETAFSKVTAQLRAKPVTVTIQDEAKNSYTITVDDLKFVQFVSDSAFVAMDYLNLPSVIYTAYQGDFQPTAKAWFDRVAGRHGETGPGSWSWSMGLYYTAECMQDGSDMTLEQARAILDKASGDPSIHDWAVTSYLTDTLAVCPAWKLTPPNPNVAVEPVTSEIPTLMLVNTFDNGLPPYLSRPAAERLPHSYFIELPAGHASVLTDCGVKIAKQFLADPAKPPDTSCTKEMKQEWVLPK